jgi:Holliday junction resolvase RusA-like endonuclease
MQFNTVTAGPDPDVLRLVVPGTPVAQPRHRHGGPRFAKRGTKRPTARAMYIPDDHPIHGYKQSVTLAGRRLVVAYRERFGRVWNTVGAMRVDILFVMPEPRVWHWPWAAHIDTPDRDNLEKGVIDALKGIFWRDDRQVADGRTAKVYSEPGTVPQTVVMVTRADRDDLPEFVREMLCP